MSNVTLAASAGFCFGVKRAIEMAYAEIEKNNGAPLLWPLDSQQGGNKGFGRKGTAYH